MEARRQRDMERARAAGARRLQQTAAAQQRVLQQMEHKQDDETGQRAGHGPDSSSLGRRASSRPASAHRALPSWQNNEPAAASPSLAATVPRARPSSRDAFDREEDDDDEMDAARAIASRHQLRNESTCVHLHRQRQANDFGARHHAAAAASSSSSAARPASAASSSAAASSASRGGGGSFSGRSSYDLAGVLRAQAAQRDRIAARQLAEQEREEAAEHAASMAAAQAALQPFEVTSEWRRRWAHTSHTAQCGICLDSFKLRAIVTQLPCAHTFHSHTCLQPWLDRQAVCPMCRYDLKQMCPANQAVKPNDEDEPFSL